MSTKGFGSKELVYCLECLKFTLKQTNSKNSSHVKYMPPDGHLPQIGIRPFMMVQLGRKSFDGQDCERYISEIKRFGFTKKEIENCL